MKKGGGMARLKALKLVRPMVALVEGIAPEPDPGALGKSSF